MIFSEKKTTDLARFFIRKTENNEINLLKLLKLLYLTDREYLDKYNTVITKDQYFSMKYGPVLSKTYDLMNEESQGTYWQKYIYKEIPHTLKFVAETKDNSIDSLTNTETETAEYINNTYGNFDTFDLVDFTHVNCKEWIDPSTINANRIDISIENILRALGRNEFEINKIILDLYFDFL